MVSNGSTVTAPGMHTRLTALRERGGTLVVVDPVRTRTAEVADVVLPTAQWAEEEGTMTNLEGRVLRRKRALPPPEGTMTSSPRAPSEAMRAA